MFSFIVCHFLVTCGVGDSLAALFHLLQWEMIWHPCLKGSASGLFDQKRHVLRFNSHINCT